MLSYISLRYIPHYFSIKFRVVRIAVIRKIIHRLELSLVVYRFTFVFNLEDTYNIPPCTFTCHFVLLIVSAISLFNMLHITHYEDLVDCSVHCLEPMLSSDRY